MSEEERERREYSPDIIAWSHDVATVILCALEFGDITKPKGEGWRLMLYREIERIPGCWDTWEHVGPIRLAWTRSSKYTGRFKSDIYDIARAHSGRSGYTWSGYLDSLPVPSKDFELTDPIRMEVGS